MRAVWLALAFSSATFTCNGITQLKTGTAMQWRYGKNKHIVISSVLHFTDFCVQQNHSRECHVMQQTKGMQQEQLGRFCCQISKFSLSQQYRPEQFP